MAAYLVSNDPGLNSIQDNNNNNAVYLDVYSVNENAADPPSETDKEVINQSDNLAFEATRINEYFANQVVEGVSTTRLFNNKRISNKLSLLHT
jgi:hypothetical protein